MVKDRLLNMPFDQFQRYRAVEEIIQIIKSETGKKRLNILDVGGYYKDAGGRDTFPLKAFLPKDRITVIDLADCRLSGYVQGNATAMPFRRGSFDVLTSLDVLEHINPKERETFLANLLRTAADFVILGAPFMSESTVLAEKILFEFIIKTLKGKHRELQEHIDHGLPEKGAMESFLRTKKQIVHCDFPCGYLNNWLLMMMVKHYVLDIPDSQKLSTLIDRFYNQNFYESDQRPPAYRHMYVISTSKKHKPVIQAISDKFKGYRDKHKDLTLEKTDFSNLQALLSLEALRDRNKIDELNSEIQNFHKQVKQLEKATKDQTSHIQNYKEEVYEKKILILNLEKKISDLEVHIQNFQREVKEKKQLMQEMKKDIKEQKKEITSQKKQIYDKEVHIRNLEQNIDLIVKSKVWRTADFFRRLFYMKILKAVPPLQKAALTITREGFSSFRQKVKQRELLRGKDLYDVWMEKHALSEEDIKTIKADIAAFPTKPKISLIMPVYNVEKTWLEKAIQSVLDQYYPNWELCIVDDASSKSHIKETLLQYGKNDKIKVKFLGKNQGISEASNEALAMASGEIVGFLDHDDELSPDALYENVKLLNDHPEADIIYSDEDKIDPDGRRIEPYFKSDWSPDLFLSYNYICHFAVYRKKLIDGIKGFRKGFEGSQDYDLLLRATEKTDRIFHIPKVLYHWRQIKGSTATVHKEKISHIDHSMKALEEALRRRKIEAEVEQGIHFERFESYRVKRKIKGSPLVSIIIPMKDMISFLQRNLKSIDEKTGYKNFEIIIIDNNSQEKETHDYFAEIRKRPNIKIYEYKDVFNFSKINNFAVTKAKGEHVLFLNNDIEVITQDWLSAMLEHSQRKEVGAVGAKLIFPNNTIQHAGTVLGLGGVAGHSHKHFPADSDGYFGALNTIRNYSAVTAACLMTRKKLFEEVGAFDDIHLSVAFNDVDLCLKIREKGYAVVYTPFAALYHYESTSRGYDLNPDEILYMKNKWGDLLFHDPYYNPNLTFDSEDFRIKIE